MKKAHNSWTIIFNLTLIGIGIAYPGLSNGVRILLINNGIIGIGLRVKTNTGVEL